MTMSIFSVCSMQRPGCKRLRSWTLGLLPVLLSACASFSPDGGFGHVAQETQRHLGVTPHYQRSEQRADAVQERLAELLSRPLSMNEAVEVALLNHRGLQARYANLGISEAELVRAGRLPNPSFSFGRLSGNGGVEYERAVMFDVLGLLTMPWSKELARQAHVQAQWQAVDDTLVLATQVKQAYVEAVAAQALLTYQTQVTNLAETAHTLTHRMREAGHVSKLASLREQGFWADSQIQADRATQRVASTREQLARALGLTGEQLTFTLPAHLPSMPTQLPPERDLAQQAMRERLDVRQATRHAEATAQALGLSKATRFVNVLHAGYQNSSETGEPRRNGYEIELQLPLFDFGRSRVAQAEAIYQQALHQAAATAIQAESDVRDAAVARQAAYAVARRYQDDIVPLRKQIAEENLLRYNGMLISVFDLLADARAQIGSVTAAMEALREYWLADLRLQRALTGRPVGITTTPATANPSGATAPAAH